MAYDPFHGVRRVSPPEVLMSRPLTPKLSPSCLKLYPRRLVGISPTMPKFYLADFIMRNGVEYIDRGPNVKKGFIYIKCPICGDEDPSHHMGISLDTNFWGCWRNPSHRGVKPQRLLQRLFGFTWAQADEIVRENATITATIGKLKEIFAKWQTPVEPFRVSPEILDFPRQMKPIEIGCPFDDRWFNFLMGKYRLEQQEAIKLIKMFDLRYALTGDFSHRIVVPIRFKKNLIGWTGRAVVESEARYKSFPRAETGDSAIKQVIFNYDLAIKGGTALVVIEGPFDAKKVTMACQDLGVVGVCSLGTSVSELQYQQIDFLAGHYDFLLLVGDNDSAGKIALNRSRQILARHNPIRTFLPSYVKDTGEMPIPEIHEFFSDKLKRLYGQAARV